MIVVFSCTHTLNTLLTQTNPQTYFELQVVIAVCYLWEPRKKICSLSHEEQRTSERSAFSELSFGLALMSSMQWFCKIPFPDKPYFELKVLIAESVSLESQEKKKSVDCRGKEQRTAFSELSFVLVSMSLRQWFCKTLIQDSTYFD